MTFYSSSFLRSDTTPHVSRPTLGQGQSRFRSSVAYNIQLGTPVSLVNMSVPLPTATKTIKLVVPPQYHDLGYEDYTATLSLSETPSTLKRAGTQNGLLDGMTLLFRGRRIMPEDEQ